MANVTIRNIPDSVLDQIKTLSAKERRSMNNQILVLLEQAVRAHQTSSDQATRPTMSPEARFEAWERLVGRWEDERSAEEIITDTDICVEILRGNRSLAEQRKAYDEPVAVSFMTVAELYYGAYKSSRVTITTMERCTFLVTGNTRHFEMIDGLEMRNWRSLR